MSLWDEIRKRAEGVIAQINPFDGGKNYDSVVNNKPVATQAPKPTATPAVVSTAIKRSPAVSVPAPKPSTPFNSGVSMLQVPKTNPIVPQPIQKPVVQKTPQFQKVETNPTPAPAKFTPAPAAVPVVATSQPKAINNTPAPKPSPVVSNVEKPVYRAVQRPDKGFDLMRNNEKIDRQTYVRESGVDENKLITGFAEKGDRVSQAYLAAKGKPIAPQSPLSIPTTQQGGFNTDMLIAGKKSKLQEQVEAAAEARRVAQEQEKARNKAAIDEILTQTDNTGFGFLGGRSLRSYKDQYNSLSPIQQRQEKQRLTDMATTQLTRENYDQKQSREEARAALAVLGEYGKDGYDVQTLADDALNIVPNIVKGTVDSYGRVTKANARALDEATVGSTRKLQESQQQGINSLNQMRNSVMQNDARFQFMGQMSPEAQQKYDALTKAIEREQAIYKESLAADYDVTDPTKYAGAGASVILDALTAGALGNIPKIAKGTGIASDAARVGEMIVNPQTVKQGLASGAALGTGYGASGALEQNGANVTPNDIVMGAIQGGLTGGLTAGGIMAISKGISRLSNNVRNNVLRTASDGTNPVDVNVKDLYSYEGAPDRARVEEYKNRIQNGGQIDPLYVMPDSKGRLTVEDGKHRLQAYIESGVDKAPVYVVSPARVKSILEGGYARIPGKKSDSTIDNDANSDAQAWTPKQKRDAALSFMRSLDEAKLPIDERRKLIREYKKSNDISSVRDILDSKPNLQRKNPETRDLEGFEYSQLDDDIMAMAKENASPSDIRQRLVEQGSYPRYEIDDAISRAFREDKPTGSEYAKPRESFEMTKGQYEPGTPGTVIKESKNGLQRERLYRNGKTGVAELVTETRNPDGSWSKKKGRNAAITNANDFSAIDKVMDATEGALDATESAKKAIKDGKELHFYARKQVGDPNNLSAEVVPFNPEKMIIDGGFVRSADTNEILGNHIKVDDTGIQINIGKNIVNMGDVAGDTSRWKNMNKTTYTLDRMLEAAAPDKETYLKTRKFIIEHKQHAEANMRQDLATYRKDISDWQKKLNGMRPGSVRKKDFGTDIFRYTERKLAQPSDIKDRKLTQDAILVEKYGAKVAAEIKNFDAWARKQYDSLLDRTNEVLREFGHDEVPKRQNYMTHLQEESFWDKIGIGEGLYRDLSSGIQGEANMTNRGQLPGTIAGRTENFRPTKKYNPFHQTRRGNESMTDPFKAMDAYGEAALFNIHMTESATRARSLEAVFRAAEEILNRDMLQQVNKDLKDSLLKAHGGSRGDLVTAFQEYANALSGKSSRFDRPLQDSGKAGRTVLRVSRALQRIASQSSIVGNINSTLSQALNLPNVIGTMGIRSTAKGLNHLINDFGMDGMPLPGTPASKSDFLKVRYTDAQSRIDRTKLQIVNRGLTKVLFMEQFERAMVESTWYAAYERALKTGFKDNGAIKEADRTTERLVAGRGIADQPEIYRSVVGKGFLQYTLEVNAALKNIRKDMTLGGVVKYAVAVYAMNAVFQTLTGRAPLPDFIGATIDSAKDFGDAESYQSDTNEKGENIGDKIRKAGQRYLGQATNLSPFTSALANNVLDQDARKALFGPDSNFGRYDGSPAALGVVSRLVQGAISLATGNPGKAWDSALSALPYGGQIRKTGQGTEAMLNGYTKDSSGNPAAAVDTSNPMVWVQAVLFGKNAIPEVKAYYENKQSALGDKQAETFKNLEKEQGKDAAVEYLNAVQDNRKSDKSSITGGNTGTATSVKNPNADYEKEKRVNIAEGKWEEKDGVVTIKETGNIAKSYYEAKAKAAIESFDDSDEAYDAILKANDIKTLGSGKAKATGNGTLDKLSQLSDIADKADIANEAVKLIKNSGKDSKVPEWATKRYLKENGIDENQAVYAAKASYNNEAKGDVIRSDIKDMSHDDVMKYLTNGRIESIAGNYWVTQGILADLRDEGVISKAEYKALNNAKYNSDGSPKPSKDSSGGSGGSSKKVSAAELGALTAGNDIASKVAKIISAAAARRDPGKITFKKR